MDIKEIIDTIKLAQKEGKVWKKWQAYLLGSAALTAYQPEQYLHNTSQSFRKLILKQWSLRTILGVLISPAIFIFALPLFALSALTRRLIENMGNIRASHAALTTMFIITLVATSFWLYFSSHFALAYINKTDDSSSQLAQADNPAIINQTAPEKGMSTAKSPVSPGITGQSVPEASSPDTKRQPPVPIQEAKPAVAPPPESIDQVPPTENIDQATPPSPSPIDPKAAMRATGLFDRAQPITYVYSYYYPLCLKDLGYKEPLTADKIDNFPDDLANCIRIAEDMNP